MAGRSHRLRSSPRFIASGGSQLWADNAYRSAETGATLKANGTRNHIHERAYRNMPLTEEQKKRNTKKSRVRARVEHVFGFQGGAMGAKRIRTNWKTMSGYRFCLPAATSVQVFQNTIAPMLERITANIHESRSLAALRDTLLPRLISGEIRVPDAEKAVEAFA